MSMSFHERQAPRARSWNFAASGVEFRFREPCTQTLNPKPQGICSAGLTVGLLSLSAGFMGFRVESSVQMKA